MSSSTQLELLDRVEDFRQKFFVKEEMVVRSEEWQNSDMDLTYQENAERSANELFGVSLDEMADLFKENIQQKEEELKADVLTPEKLTTENIEHFVKKAEEEERVFTATKEGQQATQEPGRATQQPPGSHSNDYARTSNTHSPPSSGSQQYRTQGVGNVNYYGAPKPGDKVNGMSDMGRVVGNVAQAAFNGGAIRSEQTEDYSFNGKKKWWRRVKDAIKDKPGRVAIKVGLFMALQLGIAVLGKRYVFDNWWQPVAYLSMTMGVWMVSKSLINDGQNLQAMMI